MNQFFLLLNIRIFLSAVINSAIDIIFGIDLGPGKSYN